MKNYMCIKNQTRLLVAGITGFLAVLIMSAQAITIESIIITGADNPDGSNVTITATTTGAGEGTQANMEIKSADGLICQLFPPSSTMDNTWINTDWNPYFAGDFIVTITAFDMFGGEVESTKNVTVTRTISGTINSIQVGDSSTYDPSGPWTNINTSQVILHNIGWMEDVDGMASVGCNLINADVDITPDMDEEEQDIAHTDTADYRPAGTPFRFNMLLHKRPASIMGMGEIRRFIWTPDSTNTPSGSGRLVLDVTSCSPWRNNYSVPLQAHVGFAPLFTTDDEDEALVMAKSEDEDTEFDMEGMLFCTSAHYLDVGPSEDTTDEGNLMGLKVNGHSNTTSYLKAFIPDTMLSQFGVTNVDMAPYVLAGYVTHFDDDGFSEDDMTSVTPEFTRIEGDEVEPNIIYDYNGDGIGDSGFEVRFTFTFQSPVAAQIGAIGMVSSLVAGDFDGDGKADVAVYNEATGYWYIQLSGSDYSLFSIKLGEPGYTPISADFDGDGKADVAVYQEATGYWYIQLSGSDYALSSMKLGESGYTPVPADFDGDGKADVAVYHEATGYWYVQLSGSSYALSYMKLGEPGYTPVPADFDGDGKADVAVYQEATGYWYVQLSGSSYALSYMKLGESGYTPVPADYDGDSKADVAVYNEATGYWYVQLSGSSYALSYMKLGESGYTPVPADYDGDSKADVTVYHEATGYWYIQLSGSSYALSYQKLGEIGYTPIK